VYHALALAMGACREALLFEPQSKASKHFLVPCNLHSLLVQNQCKRLF